MEKLNINGVELTYDAASIKQQEAYKKAAEELEKFQTEEVDRTNPAESMRKLVNMSKMYIVRIFGKDVYDSMKLDADRFDTHVKAMADIMNYIAECNKAVVDDFNSTMESINI